MTNDRTDLTRRALLLATAGLALPAGSAAGAPSPAPGATAPAGGEGKPGQFDFLTGSWNIHNRRRKGPDAWDEFPGESTCWSVMGGHGSIEDLRIPARDFAGLGIRLLDRERKLWTDFFVNVRSGVLAPPPITGRLVDGVFLFEAEDEDAGQKVLFRSVWDRITKTSCRWYQTSSKDGGKTWVDDWVMAWTRK